MKKAIIVGATSGIGLEVARILYQQGWMIGIAGRREDRLLAIQQECPERIRIQVLDITQEQATEQLAGLIGQIGGMDLYLHSSGIGFQNPELKPETELRTARTNTEGFIRMTTAAFHYFSKQKSGHLAVISSIAGTKGLGVAPAYSATKRFQNTYIDALEQLAHLRKLPIRFTDIRPGFVATDLLNDQHYYPLLMPPQKTAHHIVKALKRQQRIAIIDWRYALLVFFWQLIPRFIWKRMPVQTRS